jgi:hypothetical protein
VPGIDQSPSGPCSSTASQCGQATDSVVLSGGSSLADRSSPTANPATALIGTAPLQLGHSMRSGMAASFPQARGAMRAIPAGQR